MDRFKKNRNDAEKRALDAALQDFEKDFGGGPITDTKSFVRADVVNANKSIGNEGKGQLYKPNSNVFESLAAAKKPPTGASSFEEAKRLAAERAKKMMEEAARDKRIELSGPPVVVPAQNKLRPPRPGQKKEVQKSKMSNLEMFKQELMAAQEERDKRRGLREHLVKTAGLDKEAVDRIAPSLDNPYMRPGGEYDHDTETTNLYVCNLPMDVTMDELLDTFGSYGPLASARILYPRNDQERVRDHLCGFIGFMSRIDVERAMASLQGLVIRGDPIKFSLAKPVQIPPTPFYVPPALQQYMYPDAPTGIPFNARPRATDLKSFIDRYEKLPEVGSLPEREEAREHFLKMLKNAVVRVVIPTDSALLGVIHRTIEFVVRYGAIFEKMLLDEEAHNEIYQFLWNYHHPAHIYYRWKLYSILQGDDLYKWRVERFKMYEDGSWWDPPPLPGTLFSCMPRSLYHAAFVIPRPEEEERRELEQVTKSRKRQRERSNSAELRERERRRRTRLRGRDRDKLEDILRNLTPEKHNIGKAMLWCVEHAVAAKEVVECVVESLSIDETPLHKKIARLYLVSDILANCALRGVRDVFYYRTHFQEMFTKIFVSMGRALQNISARLKAEQYKQRVMACFQAWEQASLYGKEMLIHHQNIFLGLVEVKEDESSSSSDSEPEVKRKPKGAEEDIDGVPLEVAERAKEQNMSIFDEDEDIHRAVKEEKKPTGGFKPVAWAEVDPNAPPAVRSKWDEEEEDRYATSKWERVETKREQVEPERSSYVYTGPPEDGAYSSPVRNVASLSKWEEDDDHSTGEIESPEPIRSDPDSRKSESERLRERLTNELKAKIDALRRQLIEDRDPDCEAVVKRFEKEQKEKIYRQVQEVEAKESKGRKKDKKERKERDDKRSERSREKEKDRERRRSRSRKRSRSRDKDRKSERGDRGKRSRSRSAERERRRSPDRRRR